MTDVSNLVKTPVLLHGKPIENIFSYTDVNGILVCKNCTRCGILLEKSKFPSKGPNKLRSICKACYNLANRKDTKHGGITEDTKIHINFWEDSGIPIKCYVCSGPFEEIEHVLSIRLGGSDTLDNTLPVCAQCNRGLYGKRDRPLCEWLRNERPEYLDLVVSKVLSYGVDPFTECERVTVSSSSNSSNRWVFQETLKSAVFIDITDDIMRESYRAQKCSIARTKVKTLHGRVDHRSGHAVR